MGAGNKGNFIPGNITVGSEREWVKIRSSEVEIIKSIASNYDYRT